ncbi:uncharacterized protein METZ01_LOCUS473276, partial [marine metagenome]
MKKSPDFATSQALSNESSIVITL